MAALLDVAGVTTVEPEPSAPEKDVAALLDVAEATEQAAPEEDVAALDAALADAALAAAEPEAAPVDADADPFAFPPLDEEERPFLTDALVACHDSCAASKHELDAREASWGAEAPIYETSYGDGCELEVHFRQLEDRAIEFKFRCALPASPRNVLALAKEADLAPRWNSWVASAASLSDRAVGPRNFQLRRQIAINFPYPLPQPALTVRLSFHEDLEHSGTLVACVLNEPSKLGPVALGWAAVNGFARGAPVAADRSSWTVAQRVNVPGFFPMWLVTFFGRFVVRIFAPRIFEIVKKTAPTVDVEGSLFYDRLEADVDGFYDGLLAPAKLEAAVERALAADEREAADDAADGGATGDDGATGAADDDEVAADDAAAAPDDTSTEPEAAT